MFFRIIEYLKYIMNAKSEFGIHAPFAYDFYTKVIRQKQKLPATLFEIEDLRNDLLRSNETIQIIDLGTGASKSKSVRNISLLARSYANNKKDAFLMYRMIQYLKPARILELGTSLGLTTMYMAKAAGDAKIYTIEGCPETAHLAKQHFDKYCPDINLLMGNIDQVLPELLEKNFTPEFVFFDGNHTKEATLRYFELCLQYATEKTVFVFDDIYWSAGMKEAWQTIISHPEINLSLDLFRLGIVFFKKNSAKQHYVLKY
jgi:predicted O-methyltransferase YrrM